MKPIVITRRRLGIALMLVAVLSMGGVLALPKTVVDVLPPRVASNLHQFRIYVKLKSMSSRDFIVGKFASYFHKKEEKSHQEQAHIVATSPKVQDVIITDSFVCQIRSQRHIEVRALEGGYLDKIFIKEGQAVKEGFVMFKILPVLYEAKLQAESAEADIARMNSTFTDRLAQQRVVSMNEAALKKAEKMRAQAKADLAQRELDFTNVKARFDGIVDRLLQREGSLVKEGDILTTLADNSVMWVYFNVPEKYYLDYIENRKQREKEDRIELVLANGKKFPQAGTIGTIEADFNNENGNIKFRADYPNPAGVLRHGQTGTIKIRRPFKNAFIIPQRATFELLDKRYVWVVGDDDVAHQTLITIKHELEDIFVIDSGLKAGDKIILDGVREVEEGGKVEYEFQKPEVALRDLKFHAE